MNRIRNNRKLCNNIETFDYANSKKSFRAKIPDPVGKKREKIGSEPLHSYAINSDTFNYTWPQKLSKSFLVKDPDPAK